MFRSSVFVLWPVNDQGICQGCAYLGESATQLSGVVPPWSRSCCTAVAAGRGDGWHRDYTPVGDLRRPPLACPRRPVVRGAILAFQLMED